jgi:hypothetical protein
MWENDFITQYNFCKKVLISPSSTYAQDSVRSEKLGRPSALIKIPAQLFVICAKCVSSITENTSHFLPCFLMLSREQVNWSW